MKIRTLQYEHLPQIDKIQRQHKYVTNLNVKAITDYVNNDRLNLSAGVFKDETLLGHLIIRGGFAMRRIYIVQIATHKNHFRKGIANMLMENLEERCRNLGLSEIYLHVYVDNVDAVKFYVKMGFSMEKKENFYFGKSDAYRCWKILVYNGIRSWL